ncbi:MAG: ABC transporter ATP-binding protein [Sandaracinaceae bacterium]
MIEVRNLTKSYGQRTAIEGLDFRVDAGEVVGFLGPNGAGKSTTLRMLTGFLSPDRGSIRIGDVDALAAPIQARRQIGYMPEACPLYPDMRVVEYLRYRAELKGTPRRRRGELVERAMAQAAVDDVADRLVGHLSKGYRQRVGLADALVADPPLLILDEPTAGLDPNQIRQVRELIRELSADKPVLLSTHILPEVESLCDRVLILHQGRLVGEGAPGDLGAALGPKEVIHLEARGEVVAVREALEGLDGFRVRDVAAAPSSAGQSPPVVRASVEGTRGPDSVEEVFGAVVAAGLVLRELRRRTLSLEDVFTQLTTTDEAATEEDDRDEDRTAGDPPPSEAEGRREGAA